MKRSPASSQIHLTQPEPASSTKWSMFLTNVPVIQLVGAGIISFFMAWTTIQVTQSSQAAEIKRNHERIEKLEKDSVSRELFDERTQRIIDEQKKLNSMFERSLEKK